MTTYIPPLPVAIEAEKGLKLRSIQTSSNKCCTPVGIRRAVQLSNRQPVSLDTIKRMRSYFARHSVDRLGKGWGIDSKGYQAWLCWGGDAGRDWAEKILQNSHEILSRNCDSSESNKTMKPESPFTPKNDTKPKYKVISEDQLSEYDFDPYSEAQKYGIRILRHMTFSEGFVVNKKLIAALFTHSDDETFSFDIFVIEKWRGNGLAGKLVDSAVQEYKYIKADGFSKMVLKVLVVSDIMRRILLKKGFYVKNRGNGWWVMRLPEKQNNVKLIRNEYMPDEVSDNLIQSAKMIKHHMSYLKHIAASKLKKPKLPKIFRNHATNHPVYTEPPVYVNVLFYPSFGDPSEVPLLFFYESIIEARKYGDTITMAEVTCQRPAIFSDAKSAPKQSEYSTYFNKGHDGIVILSPLTVILNSQENVRVLRDSKPIRLTRNPPFLPSELKNIATTQLKMFPHHVRFVKGMLGK